MVRKKFNCNECGFMFPDELSDLIDNKTQVFCEKCGKPFSIKGIIFKPATIQPPPPPARPSKDKKAPTRKKPSQPRPNYNFNEKDREKFHNAIVSMNKFSYIPLLLVSLLLLGLGIMGLIGFIINSIIGSITWIPFINYHITLISSTLILGSSGLLIALYDVKYISPKIKNKNYNRIVIDSFCWGIVGCIVYGAGVILLLKGVAILIYNMLDNKNFGYNLKDSLNNFSAKLGLIIVILASTDIIFNIGRLNIVWMITLSIVLIILYIDFWYMKEIRDKQEFYISDAVLFFVLGIIGVSYAAAGIFILLKGILFFFLIPIKPHKEEKAETTQNIEEIAKVIVHEIKTEDTKEKIDDSIPILIKEPQEIEMTKKQVKEIKEHAKKTEKLKKEIEKKPTVEKQIELKLHESLLPVKNEKDKELVKHYFTKIFAVLSKELKNQINDLNISKKEKKELLKELAFLTQEEQLKYIESIVDLYQDIPKKLINRINKLPNVKPKHYDKIVNQLKYFDVEEQVKFVQFLEENA